MKNKNTNFCINLENRLKTLGKPLQLPRTFVKTNIKVNCSVMQSCSKAILLASIKLYCLSLPLIISHVIASGEKKEFCLMI